MPLDRGDKYEDPLDAELKERNIGEVTGGGSLLNAEKQIEWVGVDIEINDLQDSLLFVKSELKKLGAPIGSVLEITKDGELITIPIE